MATKEEISMVGFEIVAYAGDAQTDLLAALDAAREGDFEKAEQLHKDASDALIGAHDTQTKLLSQEAGGGEMEMTFIMAHAQDTLNDHYDSGEADPLYHRCLQAHRRARGQARLTSPHNQVPFQKLCRKLATGLFLFTRYFGDVPYLPTVRDTPAMHLIL